MVKKDTRFKRKINYTIEELKIAEAEDRLFILPCAVGSEIYYVNQFRPTMRIEIYYIDSIEFSHDGNKMWFIKNGTREYFNFRDIGSYIFFDKIKAEEKLKKLQKNG